MDFDKETLFLQVIPPRDGTSRRFINLFAHVDFFDLTALVCVKLKAGLVPIPSYMADDDMIKEAINNTAHTYPVRVESSNFIMQRLMDEMEAAGEPLDDFPQELLDTCVAYVVTALNGGDPAAILFYPGIFDRIAKGIEVDDYFVLFSSKEELMIIPGDFPEAAEHIKEIHTNEQAAMRSDPLTMGDSYSNSIYHYDHGRVSWIQGNALEHAAENL